MQDLSQKMYMVLAPVFERRQFSNEFPKIPRKNKTPQ
jgi:hypothetical protein